MSVTSTATDTISSLIRTKRSRSSSVSFDALKSMALRAIDKTKHLNNSTLLENGSQRKRELKRPRIVQRSLDNDDDDDDGFIVDTARALEEKSLVAAMRNETLGGIIKRLELDVSPTDLLRLNKERYDGLTLSSKLQQGTLLLTSDNVPLVNLENNETPLPIGVKVQLGVGDIVEKLQLRNGTLPIGVLQLRDGTYTVQRNLFETTFTTKHIYKTQRSAATASDKLAQKLRVFFKLSGRVNTLKLNFPSKYASKDPPKDSLACVHKSKNGYIGVRIKEGEKFTTNTYNSKAEAARACDELTLRIYGASDTQSLFRMKLCGSINSSTKLNFPLAFLKPRKHNILTLKRNSKTNLFECFTVDSGVPSTKVSMEDDATKKKNVTTTTPVLKDLVGVYPYTKGGYVVHRAYNGVDYFSDTIYETRTNAARASDVLARKLYGSEDVDLNFPSEHTTTTSLKVNVTRTIELVPVYQQDSVSGLYLCSCGKISSFHGLCIHLRRKKWEHGVSIMFCDKSTTIPIKNSSIGVRKLSEGYGVSFQVNGNRYRVDRAFETKREASRAADCARLTAFNLSSYSPLECMIRVPFLMNCPGEPFLKNFGNILSSSGHSKWMIQDSFETINKKRKVVSTSTTVKQEHVIKIKQEMHSSRKKKRLNNNNSSSSNEYDYDNDIVVKSEINKLKSCLEIPGSDMLDLMRNQRHKRSEISKQRKHPDDIYLFRNGNQDVYPCFLPLQSSEPIFLGWTDDECCDSRGNVLTCLEFWKRYNTKTGTRKSKKKWIRSWTDTINDVSISEVAKLHIWTYIMSNETEQKSQKRLAVAWCAAILKISWQSSHDSYSRHQLSINNKAMDVRSIESEMLSLESFAKSFESSKFFLSFLSQDTTCVSLFTAIHFSKKLESIEMLSTTVADFMFRNLKDIMGVRSLFLSLSLSVSLSLHNSTTQTLHRYFVNRSIVVLKNWRIWNNVRSVCSDSSR